MYDRVENNDTLTNELMLLGPEIEKSDVEILNAIGAWG